MCNQNVFNIGCEKNEILVEHVNVKNGRKNVFTYIDILHSVTCQSLQAIWYVHCLFLQCEHVRVLRISFVQQSPLKRLGSRSALSLGVGLHSTLPLPGFMCGSINHPIWQANAAFLCVHLYSYSDCNKLILFIANFNYQQRNINMCAVFSFGPAKNK